MENIHIDDISRIRDNNKVIDARSDFIGRPTQEMIQAMTKAAGNPVSFGLREDPTTIRLEKLAAEILGKEDALFLPTTTMANLIAASIHCLPGQELIAEEKSHMLILESGGIAALYGIMAKPIAGKMGMVDLKTLELAISSGTDQQPKTGLILLENTHNHAGGTVLTLEQMASVEKIASRFNIPVHLDGARVFNAAAFLGVPVSKITRYVDSVAVSLRKGLCAPLGAILAGRKVFIQEAGRQRLMLGGGWRTSGILASAAIVSLEKMVDRLVEDHKIARKIAEGITSCPGVFIDLKTVQTNLVYVQIKHPSLSIEQFVLKLKKENILVNITEPDWLRIAIHREIKVNQANKIIEAFQQISKA